MASHPPRRIGAKEGELRLGKLELALESFRY
jgi:hypothetical protein